MAFIGQGAWTIGTESSCQTGIVSQSVTGIPVTATQIRFNYYVKYDLIQNQPYL